MLSQRFCQSTQQKYLHLHLLIPESEALSKVLKRNLILLLRGDFLQLLHIVQKLNRAGILWKTFLGSFVNCLMFSLFLSTAGGMTRGSSSMQMNRLPYLVFRSSLSRENHSEVGYRPGSGLEAPAGQALLNKQKGSHDLSGDECLLEGMWCEVTVQSGAEQRGEKNTTENSYQLLF